MSEIKILSKFLVMVMVIFGIYGGAAMADMYVYPSVGVIAPVYHHHYRYHHRYHYRYPHRYHHRYYHTQGVVVVRFR